jgi:hypothetical protein
MAIGAVYAIINALLCRLYAEKPPEKSEIDIKPDFQKAIFEVHFTFITSVRVSALFTIGAAVIFLFLRNRAIEKHP